MPPTSASRRNRDNQVIGSLAGLTPTQLREALNDLDPDDVRKIKKSCAQMMISDHGMTTRTLKTALKSDREVPPPPMTLPADKQALVAQLRSAPADGFDSLYWQQQLQAHQEAWALHKGFATSGSDPALQSVATSAVPVA